jgi:hypothetical protein
VQREKIIRFGVVMVHYSKVLSYSQVNEAWRRDNNGEGSVRYKIKSSVERLCGVY